jgi:predicted acyltransferase (DUF342 family)
MSNSWRKFGGTSKLDIKTNLQVGTIIADQFVSRSSKLTTESFPGSLSAAANINASIDFVAGNSLIVTNDTYNSGNVYIDNQLFFGNTFVHQSGKAYAYINGNASNIGINTLTPSTTFDITGATTSTTNILTVESSNPYIRNILAQNANQYGLVVDASDANTNIYFFNDLSTNAANKPSAAIGYSYGGNLLTTTTNRISISAPYLVLTSSGGYLSMTRDSAELFMTGNITTISNNHTIDASGNIYVNSLNNYTLTVSGGLLDISGGSGVLSCSGSILFHSSGGLITVDSNSGIGNVVLNANNTQFNSILSITPPLSSNRGVSGEMFNETILIFDSSNTTYLPNVYNDGTVRTGNSLTLVAADNSSNTFVRVVAPNNMGLALNGGVFPTDTTKTMVNIALSDICGNFVPSHTIVSGNNIVQYLSTTGINTFAPRINQYVFDINGATRIGNGELTTVANLDFEIKQVVFSKSFPNAGIAIGTSSSTGRPYTQKVFYTKNGGKTWSSSDITQTVANLNTQANIPYVVTVYDTSYAFIGTTSGFLYYTSNGGVNWQNMYYTLPGSKNRDNNANGTYTAANILNTTYTDSVGNTILRTFIPYSNTLSNKTLTTSIFAFDVSVNMLSTVFAGDNVFCSAISSTISTSNNKIVSGDSSGAYAYFVGGNVILKYNISSPATNPIIDNSFNTTDSYTSISVYNDGNAIAVGGNIISYCKNNTWTNIYTNKNSFANLSFTPVNLRSVSMYDLSRAIAVGDNGLFLYTVNGFASANWQTDTNGILNTSGLSYKINNYNLRSVSVVNSKSFVISAVISSYANIIQQGNSTLLYGYFPNLLDASNNRVFDVSGSMFISGDINVNDGGQIATNNNQFNLLQHNVTNLTFAQDTSFVTMGNFNMNTTLNGNLLVTNNSVFALDVSANNRVFVCNDVSLNKNVFVNGSLSLPGTSTIYTNNINSTVLSPNYKNTSGNVINIGGNTRVTNIGLYDSTYAATINGIAGSGGASTFINIGTSNPSAPNQQVAINIGNWSTDVTALPNAINMGGGTDLVTIGGNIYYKNTTVMLYNNPALSLNVETNSSFSTPFSTIIDISGYISGNTLTVTKGNSSIGPNYSGLLLSGNPSVNLSAGTIINSFLQSNSNGNNYAISNYYNNPSSLGLGTSAVPVDFNLTNAITAISISGYFVQGATYSPGKVGNVLYVNTALTVGANTFIGNIITTNGNPLLSNISSFNNNTIISGNIITSTGVNVFLLTNTNGFNGSIGSSSTNALFTIYGNTNSTTPISTVVNLANGYGTSAHSGVYINDNNDIFAGHMRVSKDMSGYNFKPPNTGSNVVRLDVNSLLLNRSYVNTNTGINGINNGLLTLSAFSDFTDSSYSIGITQIDTSNILLRDMLSTDGVQIIDTALVVQKDVSMNNRLYVAGDVSLNGNLYVQSDLTVNGRLLVKEYQSQAIMNTTVTNYYYLQVLEDISMSGRLLIQSDVSASSRLFVKSDVSFNSRLGVLGDVSFNNRLFVGSDVSFNSRLSVLGDVSFNNRLFVGSDVSLNSRLGVLGDVSFNNRLFVGSDVSLNSRLGVLGDVSLNNRLFVGSDVSFNGRLAVLGDVSFNNRLFVGFDASFGRNMYIANFVGVGISASIYTVDISGSVNLRGPTNPITFLDNTTISSNATALDFSNNYASVWVQVPIARIANYQNTNTQSNWSGVAMSTTGQYQIAYVGYNSITSAFNAANAYSVFMSNDFGLNWRSIFPNPINTTPYINNAAISGTGQYITLDISGDGIYTSSNFGSSFVHISNSVIPNQFTYSWQNIALSITGQYQTACELGGNVFTSTNYGTGWTTLSPSLADSLVSNSMSSSGQYQTICSQSGNIYTSINYGTSWSKRATGLGSLSAIAMSSTGQCQATCAYNGYIYISSNYGFSGSWIQTGPSVPTAWQDITMTANGQYLLACSTTYTWSSTNYGNIWTRSNSPQACSGISISSNGQFLLTAVPGGPVGGNLYSSTVPYPSMYINNGLSVIGDLSSVTGRLNVGADVSMNNRLFVGSDVSFNARLSVYADVSLNNRLFVASDVILGARLVALADVSFNNRLFVGSDASINGNVITSNYVGIGKYPLYPLDITSQKVNTATSGSGSFTTSYYNNYTVLTFTSGTNTFTINSVAASVPFGYIVVGGGGGGGGGGAASGGSGGAGASIEYGLVNSTPNLIGTNTSTFSSNSTTYTVTIGSGGNGGSSGNGGASGSNSSISGTGLTTVTAIGGASGAGNGSGTGATASGSNAGVALITGGGGGGGGTNITAASGSNSSNSINTVDINILGKYYACGGGGGGASLGGSAGGNSPGVAISNGSSSGQTATANTGGGGGGGAYNTAGGAGGSGIVIIYFPTYATSAAANVNSSVLINNGYLGIGTGNNAIYPLDISSSSIFSTVRIGGNINYPPVASSPFTGQVMITPNLNYGNSKMLLGMTYNSGLTFQSSYIQSTNYNGSTDIGQYLLLNPGGGNVSVGKLNPQAMLDVNGFLQAITLGITGSMTIGTSTSNTSSVFTVYGATTMGGTANNNATLLTVNGSTVIGGSGSSATLNVTGVTTISNNLVVNNSGTLSVAGATTLSGTLNVTGGTTVSNNLSTTNGGTLTVAGATTLSSTLGVTGATTLSNTLNVTGVTTLSNNLSTTSGGTLTVAGATTLSSTLNVTGITTLSSTLNVTGATTLSSTLGVTGNITAGNVTATTFTATSDYRAKTNIKTLDATFSVDTLNPIHYYNTLSSREDIGLLAHELQEYYPFLVNGEKDGEQYQSVNYNGLIGLLIHEVKLLKRIVYDQSALLHTILRTHTSL